MGRKEELEKLTEKEMKIAEEIEKEAEKEIKEETPEKTKKKGRTHGIIGILIAVVGLFLPTPLQIFMGMLSLLLARSAIMKGQRKLGIIGGILGFINIVCFAFYTGSFVTNWS